MITLRPATLADITAILEIYNDAALKTTATADTEPATLAQRTEWFDFRTANGYPILVSLDESEIVTGWSSLSPYHLRYGYRFTAEVSVYIAEKSRGKGIGKALLNALLEATDPLKFHSLVASIDSENAASIHLHKSFGFLEMGTLKEIVFKFDRWLDVVYLQKIL